MNKIPTTFSEMLEESIRQGAWNGEYLEKLTNAPQPATNAQLLALQERTRRRFSTDKGA